MEGKILRQYLNYLFNFGFLSGTNITDFISIYQSISENYSDDTSQEHQPERYIREKMSLCFIQYLNSLNNDQKKNLSNNLFSHFLTSRESLLQQTFFNLIKIYEKQKLFPKFQKWKKNIVFTSFLSSTIMSNQTSPTSQRVRLMQNRQSKKKSPRQSLNKSRPHSNNETSQQIKEQEELSHCTFQPDIKDTFSYYYNNISRFNNFSRYSKDSGKGSVHDRLYNDYKTIMDKREVRALEKNTKEAQASTFRPTLMSNSKICYNNFVDRQKEYENKKNDNIDKIILEMDNNFNVNCSFSPNISPSQRSGKKINLNKSLSHSFSAAKIPVYERLYEYNKIRKQNSQKKQQQIKDEIKIMALSPSMRKIQNSNMSPSVDYKKIEELYKDYQKVKQKINKKRNDINIEQGVTFKPELYTNEKYYDKINPNFHDREKQFILEKQKFVEYCQQMNEEQLTKQKWGNGKYTNKEKEQITNNIIERLYKKGLQQYSERRGMRVYTSKEDQTGNEENENTYNNSNPNNGDPHINSNTYSVSQLPIAYNNNENVNKSENINNNNNELFDSIQNEG